MIIGKNVAMKKTKAVIVNTAMKILNDAVFFQS